MNFKIIIYHLRLKTMIYNFDLIPNTNEENQYICFLNFYIDLEFQHIEDDIISYLKMAGYNWIKFTKHLKYLNVEFKSTFQVYDAEAVQEMISNISEDFDYALKILNNEKKLLKHYPSIIKF